MDKLPRRQAGLQDAGGGGAEVGISGSGRQV